MENTGECSNNDNETVEARENYAGEINDSSIISEDINVDANENFHEDVDNVSAVTSEDFELCENIVDGGIDAAVAVENDGMDVTKEESVDDDGDNWIGVSITDVRSGTGDPTQLKEQQSSFKPTMLKVSVYQSECIWSLKQIRQIKLHIIFFVSYIISFHSGTCIGFNKSEIFINM